MFLSSRGKQRYLKTLKYLSNLIESFLIRNEFNVIIRKELLNQKSKQKKAWEKIFSIKICLFNRSMVKLISSVGLCEVKDIS